MGGTQRVREITAPIRVSGLGDLRIDIDGQRIDVLVPDKAALLLVYPSRWSLL